MKYRRPCWIDKSIMDGLEDVSGLFIVHDTHPSDFTQGPVSILISEPRVIHPHTYRFVEDNIGKYHRIYTFDDVLLQKSKNARLLPFGTSFLDKNDILSASTDNKSGISFMCGFKQMAIGHRIRHIIYFKQNEIEAHLKRELSFWRSGAGTILRPASRRGNPVLPQNGPAKLRLHAPYQFSIIIENSQQKNYFTEKIIDCMLCKTVPIYWGCPNIGEFFSTDGILILNGSDTNIIRNLEDVLKVCDTNLYDKMKPAIEHNYKESFKYAFNYQDRLKALITNTALNK